MQRLRKTTFRRNLSLLTLAIASIGFAVTACTDVNIYEINKDPLISNKLTVSGTVCSDDPRQRDFPVKVLFVVDQSLSFSADENDPGAEFRIKALKDVFTKFSHRAFEFGVITFDATAKNLVKLADAQHDFTSDVSALNAYVPAELAKAGTCLPGEQCRNFRGAMGLASSVITGDALSSDPGKIAKTTYIVVMITNGPPVPSLGRCECRDDNSPCARCFSECEGCKVSCPSNTRCQNDQCIPECDPECGGGQVCDCDLTGNVGCYTQGANGGGAGVCSPLGPAMPVPDTFIQRATQACNCGGSGNACCDPNVSCVPMPDGNPNSCEEQTMVRVVRELRTFVKQQGAAGFQFHTTYLPDGVDYTNLASSAFAPPCGPDATRTHSTRLLSEMAFAGNGGFWQLQAKQELPGTVEKIVNETFISRDPLVIKELVVSNVNVIADGKQIVIDTDQDGLSDDTEIALGTCVSDPDTDGDGLSDAIEVKLATDPLTIDERLECVDIATTTISIEDRCTAGGTKNRTVFLYPEGTPGDKDGDGLNVCEERLLGTEDTLFDTDADGLPDPVEVSMGTNFLAVDTLDDIESDGIINRDEVRSHTDPRSNDVQTRSELGYVYEELDEGIAEVLTVSESGLQGIHVKKVAANSPPGSGILKLDLSSGTPMLSWMAPDDRFEGRGFGPPIDISQAADDIQLESATENRFLVIRVEGANNYDKLPTGETTKQTTVTVSSAPRNCLRFRVRNITLMETEVHPITGTQGLNNIFIYFSQAPQGSKDTPGIFRVANVAVEYRLGPPEVRNPKRAEITFTDDDFVLFE